MNNQAHKRVASLQQVFDRAARHMKSQGVKSEDCGASLYHGPKGLKCGVGHFIPACTYSEQLEGLPVDDPLILQALDVKATPAIVRLLELVQEIHDCVPAEAWRSRFRRLGKKLKLSLSSVDGARR